MKKLFVNLIEFYQAFLSFDKGVLAILAPGGACKHEISCSEYTKQMISRHGVIQGIRMGVCRIWGCR